MALPPITQFTLHTQAVRQEDIFPSVESYYFYLRNYCKNLRQFTRPSVDSIEKYIDDTVEYIGLLVKLLPRPPANPYYIYASLSQGKAPPVEPTDVVDLVNVEVMEAVREVISICAVVFGTWINKIVTPEKAVIEWTKQETWTMAKGYADLLIKQYRGMPRAYSTIAYLSYYLLLLRGVTIPIQYGFNVFYATGYQLDIIGNKFGLSRHISFTMFEGTTDERKYTTLTDKQFRVVLLHVISGKATNFSYKQIPNTVSRIFQKQVTVATTGQMDLGYYIRAYASSDIYIAFYALAFTGLLQAPAGVQAFIQLVSPDTRPFFALSTATKWSSALEGGLIVNPDNFAEARILKSEDLL